MVTETLKNIGRLYIATNRHLDLSNEEFTNPRLRRPSETDHEFYRRIAALEAPTL